MPMSKHPTPSPSPPRRPPSDRQGQGARKSGEDAPYGAKNEFGGYEHSSEHHHNDYGHQRSLEHHAPHKSEFEGGHSFSKAGDTDTTWVPEPHKGESMADYMGRFMGSSEAKKDFKSRKQRIAVGLNMYRESKKKRRKS